MGTEVCEELEAEYARVRAQRAGLAPLLWLAVQVVRPSTWALAWRLRRSFASDGSGTATSLRGKRAVLGGSWLDMKLAWRMLRKYPGLSLLGVLSISVAVAVAAGFWVLSSNFLAPRLPIEEGDRLVGIQNWDVASNQPIFQELYDYGVWRDELESVEELGAFVPYAPNLIFGDGRSEPVRGCKITASALAAAHVPPLLGRPLLDSDERSRAAEVAVIGYELWQRLFGGDPAVIGSTVRLGQTPHTIVGVMPAEFRYPFSYELWVPLREDPLTAEPLEGPPVEILGRLNQGFTMDEARAELTLIGDRMATEHPDTHGSLRPRIQPYALSQWRGPTTPFTIGRLTLVILLLVVCANVGALVYARNATRIPRSR